jgi:exonuclease SbcC
MTRNQLALSINETTEFFVTDYLNDGKTRPVRTLSGGQTFQAALCLALSLSELIAAGENQFFFLDEGFGTQDKDALNEVVNALQSLQKEGRVVGIISHVEELKQLLDVSLLVENDPINGSTVRLN